MHSAQEHYRIPQDRMLSYLERLSGFRYENFSSDLLGVLGDFRRGRDAHSADLCVKPDEGGNVRLVVLEGVDVAFRSLLDGFLVDLLTSCRANHWARIRKRFALYSSE